MRHKPLHHNGCHCSVFPPIEEGRFRTISYKTRHYGKSRRANRPSRTNDVAPRLSHGFRTKEDGMERMKLWIDGQWVAAESGETMTTTSPSTGETVGEVPKAAKADVDKSVAAAKRAFPEWSGRTPAERATVLTEIGAALKRAAPDMARWDALEHGLPISQALGPALASGGNFDTAAALSRSVNGDLLRVSNPKCVFVLDRVPIGVCALITPWNMPLFLLANKIALCIAMGNTCVVKPPSCNSVIGLKLAEVLDSCKSLPEGVVNIITGSGSDMGSLLSSHPDIDCIGFTGSTETGSQILVDSAATCKKTIMELGGKNPAIICSDAPIEQAAKILGHHQFFNCGQACGSPGRIYVHENVYDEFLEAFLDVASSFIPGDPLNPETTMGPLVTKAHLSSVLRYIESAKREGATLVTGGEPLTDDRHAKGNYLPPTVFTDVTPDMTIYREEIFGPVAAIVKFSDERTAIEQAADNTYGLTASIWSRDIARALKIGKGLRVGTLSVNEHNCLGPEVCWGGVKQSGIGGKEGGLAGLLAFTEEKVITISLE